MTPEFMLTIVVQIAIGGYVYGRLTERTNANTKTIAKQQDAIADHGERISAIEGALPCLTMGAKAGH